MVSNSHTQWTLLVGNTSNFIDKNTIVEITYFRPVLLTGIGFYNYVSGQDAVDKRRVIGLYVSVVTMREMDSLVFFSLSHVTNGCLPDSQSQGSPLCLFPPIDITVSLTSLREYYRGDDGWYRLRTELHDTTEDILYRWCVHQIGKLCDVLYIQILHSLHMLDMGHRDQRTRDRGRFNSFSSPCLGIPRIDEVAFTKCINTCM